MLSHMPFSSMDVTLTSVFPLLPYRLCLPDIDYWALLSLGHDLFTSACLMAPTLTFPYYCPWLPSSDLLQSPMLCL